MLVIASPGQRCEPPGGSWNDLEGRPDGPLGLPSSAAVRLPERDDVLDRTSLLERLLDVSTALFEILIALDRTVPGDRAASWRRTVVTLSASGCSRPTKWSRRDA
ncbi:hypothetical protein AArcCO_1313 [Halalkaliarchaeum sp. AArc-CO]|uniref:hypothetical protein n=1 Tax=Halalkaliarchaeum sp. AArc-GB TaxID=3074078 RepID=UPI002862951B|nr:hypothetical protein [Halalkaliarchaeum sp. AArc-GB]MDR5673986.1 hypothetical protein [Halalkaliarchaeum sp. AArc-GB]UWG50622.1 hypothetical protein AArcCO_1313 [Halalkaliarchaeum sp. AArc-CO]